MDIQQMKVGFLDVFCYLVACPRTKDSLVIDPAGDEEKVVDEITKKGLNLTQKLDKVLQKQNGLLNPGTTADLIAGIILCALLFGLIF